MKKKVIFLFCTVFILLILISIKIIHLEITPSTANKKKVSENTPTAIPSNSQTARKIQDCFEAHLPAKYNIQCNNDTFEAVITYNGNDIGYFTLLTCPDTTTDALASIEGMHAYPKEESEIINRGTFIQKKIKIGYELSAAQNERGEKTPEDELHFYYYYTDKENHMVGDLYFTPNSVSEKEMNAIANSIIYKP